MRTLPAFCCLISLLLALRGAQALDLTPISGFKDLDGVKIPIIEFVDGSAKINYKPPAGWRPSGGGDSLSIYPPGGDHSWMEFLLADRSPAGGPAASTASGEEVEALARGFIPSGAKDIALVSKANNSFTLEGQPRTEFIFAFSSYGSRQVASISLVNRTETKWFVVVVSSHPKDFDSIREQAISSLFSWRRVQ